MKNLTSDSRIVIGDRPAAVQVSAFGWYVVATLGGSFALLAVSLAIWSLAAMRSVAR